MELGKTSTKRNIKTINGLKPPSSGKLVPPGSNIEQLQGARTRWNQNKTSNGKIICS